MHLVNTAEKLTKKKDCPGKTGARSGNMAHSELLLELHGEQFLVSAPSDATWGWVLSHAIRLVGEPASGPVWVGLHCK